jgi:predicted metalloprotease
MMSKMSKGKMRPHNFERLMSTIKMYTNPDINDGLVVNLMMPFSQRFQLGGTWNYSNVKAGSFQLMSVLTQAVNEGKQGMPEEIGMI